MFVSGIGRSYVCFNLNTVRLAFKLPRLPFLKTLCFIGRFARKEFLGRYTHSIFKRSSTDSVPDSVAGLV